MLSVLALTPAAAADLDGGIEEIVVTATKRELSVQDVPVAMQAFTAATLENMGADQVDGYYRMVPNFAVVDRGAGGKLYSIRGISTGLVTQGASTVGVYIDEMPISAAGFQPDPRLFDIERVEVLRGPQGTLYGEGSIGGTVRMITPRPDPAAFDGKADVSWQTTADGDPGYKLNAMLNLPLVDDVLALRVSGLYHDLGGYIDRIAMPDGVTLDVGSLLGLPPGVIPLLGTGPLPGKKDINGEVSSSGRASLLWNASERLTLEASFMTQRLDADGRNTSVGGVAGVGELESNFVQAEKVTDDFDLGNLTISYDLGWARLFSSTSKYERTRDVTADTNDLGEAIFPTAKLPGSGTFTTELQDMTSEELRLSSTGDGPLSWIAGYFYVDKDNGFEQIIVDDYDVFVGFMQILGLPVTNARQLLDQTGRQEETQHAFFGELTYAFTEKLSATVGLRYFDIEQRDTLVNNDINILGLGLTDGVSETGESDSVMKFNVNYRASDDVLLWATASQGFRIGGTNTTPGIPDANRTYGSDTLWNYEVGARTSWYENRLVLNSALYYIDWSDIQLALPLGTAFGTINAGQARIIGAELELQARPAAGLDLSLTAGYNDGELTEDTPGAPAGPNPGFKGDRLPGVPRLNLAAGAQYTFPLASGGLDGFGRVDYSYTGDSTTTFNDLSTANGLPSHFNPDAYGLLNLRLGVQNERWTVALFVDNATDERAELLIDNASVTHRITRNRPRTFGMNVRFDF
ncbi:MAG TPA: TonB-dependent receptor [Steroidobacteraceae bacterium]|nr:TonB-dependent receptor [Steroidobacteraceae bacterium]